MSLTGEYRAVKYSGLFAISCVLHHQFGNCSHVMLSNRQGKYSNKKETEKAELYGQFKAILGELILDFQTGLILFPEKSG